jgi:hypothetical protein
VAVFDAHPASVGSLERWRSSPEIEIYRWADEAEGLAFDRASADTYVLGVTELRILDIASSESLSAAEISQRFAGEHALDVDAELHGDVEEMLRELTRRGLVVRLLA